MFLPVSMLLSLVAAAADSPSVAERAALAEMEAKIKVLKAEGKLPEGPEPSTAKKPTVKAPDGCVRLSVGQADVINMTIEQSPTGVNAEYGLSRPEEKKFIAEINLKFVKGPGLVTEETPEALEKKYRAKADECLRKFEDTLKDSKTGALVVLRITDNSAVPQRKIEIMPNGARSSSYQYAADASCSTILHEALHVLGLADEYPHKPGLTEVYKDCRPAAPNNSVMGNHYGALKSIEPRMGYSIERCKCDVEGAACWELAMKSNGKVCPAGTTSFFEKLDPGLKTSLNVLNNGKSFVLDAAKMKESGFEAPERESILFPAHFRAITQPGCKDVNKNYYDCSQNAYRFSKPAIPEELNSTAFGCKPVPEACRWRSFKWLE